jgi:uncharacterized protein YndB with AHSA1/START domain
MKKEPVIVERTFNAPVNRVWNALTDKDQMKHWYFDLAEFKAEPGFEFHFDGENKGVIYHHLCQVTEVIKGKKLSYSWRYQGYEGISLVCIELFAEGDKTRLKLTHSGLESFPQDIPDFAKENFVMGWTQIIGSSLRGYLEKQS